VEEVLALVLEFTIVMVMEFYFKNIFNKTV